MSTPNLSFRPECRRPRRFKVVHKQLFLQALLNSPSHASSYEFPGIYPSPTHPVRITFHQIKFAQGLESTYMLSYNKLLWLDESEIKFFSRWITRSPFGHLEISFESPLICYSDVEGTLPVWITAGLSRGSHSFHYAHFVVDQLVSASYVSCLLDSHNPLYIQDISQTWQASLLRKYSSAYNAFTLVDASSLRTPEYPNIVSHEIKACLFDFSPQLNSSMTRYALLKEFLSVNNHRDFQPANIHDDTCVNSDTEVWFLSRSRVPNVRLVNEHEVISVLTTIFPRTKVIHPQEHMPYDLIKSIETIDPLIFSASSGALDPLMILSRYLPRIIMFFPFTHDEIYGMQRAAGIYRDISVLSGCDQRLIAFGVSTSMHGASWNTPIKMNIALFSKVLQLIIGSPFSRYAIEGYYSMCKSQGEYAVQIANEDLP